MERMGLPQGAFGDCLPIWNEKKDICLIFSGEDFADQADIDALRMRGHEFGSDDASYLVHLYEEMGCEFLEKLNGWFSGVLLDLREQKFVLFNDRYGVNRIYYHEDASGFYFSSEAKALLKILPATRQLNLRSLGEVLCCEAVLENRSLFSGISLLPPGSSWVFSRGEPVKKKTYFKQETWESQPELSESEFYEKLRETWTRVLPKYFSGKQSIGLSLTGGVDSRMILAWAPLAPGELPCYTWGGTYRDCADVKIARRTAKLCQQPHNTILRGRGVFVGVSRSAEKVVYISDGTMDVTGSIDVYVQRLARQIAPVRVSGVCGGEILRRLVMFKPDPPQEDFFDPELECSFREPPRPMPVSSKAIGFPSLPSSKRRGIWLASLRWNDRKSHIERLILITIWLHSPTKRRPDYCTIRQHFGSLLMATKHWERSGQIVALPFDRFRALIGYFIGTRSSRLKRNTPMTIACHNGWRESTTPLLRFSWKGCSLAGTSSIISVSGIAMNYRDG